MVSYGHDVPAPAGVRFRLRRIDVRAWSLYLGLTIPFAILAHLAFDVADAGLSAAVFLRPAHLVLVALLAVACAAAAYGLGYGQPDAERRRSLALVRAALRADRRPLLGVAVSTVAQAMIALATITLDEALLHPERLVLAVLTAVLAVVAGSLATRLAKRRVLDLALTPVRRRGRRAAAIRRRIRAARFAALYALFRPNRAPPLLTASV
jgi:hypothetical protein